MQTLLLYSPIYDFIVEDFVRNLKQIPDNEDVLVRLNSPGGDVFAGWSIISALTEREGKFNLRIEGHAASMGFIFALFADNVEALDVTKLMIHRATGYVENEDDQKMLNSVNKDLRNKLEKRIDADKFADVAKVTIDDIFDQDERRDIWLTSRQARKIGLVDKVIKLDPGRMAAMGGQFVGFEIDKKPENNYKKENNYEPKDKKMNKSELKNTHPDIYNEIMSEGVNAERMRVESWLSFDDIDVKAVREGIKKGEEVNQKVIAEMSRKAMSAEHLNGIKKDSKGDVETSKDDKKDEKQAEVEAYQKKVFSAAGIKMEDK